MNEDVEVTSSRDTSSWYYIVTFAGVLLVMLLGNLAPLGSATKSIAIAIGIFVPSGIGLAMLLLGALERFQHRGHATGDADFSSWSTVEERAFVGHEKAMRANEGRASAIGWGVAGAMFVLGLLLTWLLYTPCTRLCDRPPGVCTTEKQIADWRAGCASSCAALEKQGGLQLLKHSTEDDKKLSLQPVSGAEYVDSLASCVFANGAGPICERLTGEVTKVGLWCAEKP